MFTVRYTQRLYIHRLLKTKTIRKTFRCKTLLRAIRAGQRQLHGTDTENLLIEGEGFSGSLGYHTYCRKDRMYRVDGWGHPAYVADRGQWCPSISRV